MDTRAKQAYLQIILSFSFLSFTLEQCIQGSNCPINQGKCVADQCNCLEGFYTLMDPALPLEQQVYCNYEQINVYIPLLLELFLPSVGHFYAGKYWLGLLKLSLLIVHITTSLILFGFIGVPKFLIFIMDKFGISLNNFLPEGALEIKNEEEEGDDKDKDKDDDEEKEDDENDDKKEDKTETKLKELSTKLVNIKNLLRDKIREENVNRGNTVQTKQVHSKEGNDFYTPELEQALIDKEDISEKVSEEKKDDDEETKEPKNKLLENIFHLSTIGFWTLYLLDLFLYKSKVYDDGYNVPFV
jgi:hypothetical protein